MWVRPSASGGGGGGKVPQYFVLCRRGGKCREILWYGTRVEFHLSVCKTKRRLCDDDDINNITLLVLPSKCSVENKIHRLVKINFQLTFGICRATCLKIGYFHLTGGRVEYEFRSLAIGLSINLAAAHHITTFKRNFPEQFMYSESRILIVIIPTNSA